MKPQKKPKLVTAAVAGTPLVAQGRAGYIADFISGTLVKATPEEKEVQVFSMRLVEDYDYPRNHIQTRPQFRVKKRPSEKEKSYPVDIAVFSSSTRTDSSLFMVVECKQRSRKEGLDQLKLYLDMSAAEIGVWFNGDDHEYLRKVHHRDGSRTYTALPNIPRYGQRIEDIGLFTRKDLRKPSNLRAVFRDIRNHLAGMTTGITRDETLAQQIINILFCKILDEQETESGSTVSFRAGVGEPAAQVRARILSLFDRVKQATFGDVFKENDSIGLDPESLRYVVGELQNYCVMEADRDAIGDAFEVFIGPALRGAEGQFFTPRNVIDMMVGIVDPSPADRIIDPACGSGGFLIGALDTVWKKLRETAKSNGWSEKMLAKREIEVASDNIRGIDKDEFLSKVSKAYMALVGDGRGGVFCENSLQCPQEWEPRLREKIKLGAFDVVLTNPPFGNRIVVKGEALLSQYEFGYRWKKVDNKWQKTSELFEEQPPQLLFLERSLQLLKQGGRLGIVMPESILGNPSYSHIVSFLLERFTIRAVITMPEALFKTSGKGGTHTKVCTLIVEKQAPSKSYKIFMGEAKWCGHDSRGNPTIRQLPNGDAVLLDDVPVILQKYRAIARGAKTVRDHLGFLLESNAIRNQILVPKYYNPEIERDLSSLKKTYDLVQVGKLVEDGDLSIETGVEIGKMAYGTGRIPFIRTSDISNWEIKEDYKHGVSQDIYEQYRGKVDVEPNDILMVRDGTYLIGTTAIVTKSDIPMLFQSHIYRIRVLRTSRVNAWLLISILNSPIVKRQIRAKQFTQDIIDTIGKRLYEVVLPIPKDSRLKKRVSDETEKVIHTRIRLRNRIKEIAYEVQGLPGTVHEEEDPIEEIGEPE